MICKQLAANDQSCKYDGVCLSVHCVNEVCKSFPLPPAASCDDRSVQCSKGYSCIQGMCKEAKKIGDNCTRSIISEGGCVYPESKCLHEVCTKVFSQPAGKDVNQLDLEIEYFCESTRADSNGICLDAKKMPKLKVDIYTNYSKCVNHTDCIYTNPYNLPLPSNPCMCPTDSATGQKYCKFGGGEEFMIEAVKQFELAYVESQQDLIHNATLSAYQYNAHLYYRNNFAEPASCSAMHFYKGLLVREKQKPSLNIIIICAIIVALALVPIIFVLVSMICIK